MFFTDDGNMYKLKGSDLPELKWRDKGERLDNIVKGCSLSREKLVAVLDLNREKYDYNILMTTSEGGIKKTPVSKFDTSYSKLAALKLKNGEKLVYVKLIDKNSIQRYFHVSTKCGLEFIVPAKDVGIQDRNIVSRKIFELLKGDCVLKMEPAQNREIKKFYIVIDRQGILKSVKSARKSLYSAATDSCSRLYVFTKDGTVFSIQSFMLENAEDGVSIESIFGIHGRNDILYIVSIKDFRCGSFYFFTKHGMIKKTKLSMFEENKMMETAYKFKDEDDVLLKVKYFQEDKGDIVIFTENGMCIRFMDRNVNCTGKISCGTVGINRKDDDSVVYADIVSTEDKVVFELKCEDGKDTSVEFSDIKPQNRGGRGRNIFDTKNKLEKVILKKGN